MYDLCLVFIRDIGSSNGTFVNSVRLSPEGLESEAKEIKNEDEVCFGLDIFKEDASVLFGRVKCKIRIKSKQINEQVLDIVQVSLLLTKNEVTKSNELNQEIYKLNHSFNQKVMELNEIIASLNQQLNDWKLKVKVASNAKNEVEEMYKNVCLKLKNEVENSKQMTALLSKYKNQNEKSTWFSWLVQLWLIIFAYFVIIQWI